MEYIAAKTIVSKIKPSPFWFLTDYNMNIYRGCCHGCIYCDSRSSCYNIPDFDSVKAKKDALSIIYRELKSKRVKGVIATGAMSDPYNPLEEKLQLTGSALKIIEEFGFGLSIATKSALITRDTGVIKKISLKSPAIIKITITAHEDNTAKIIEPFAPPPSQRFEAVKHLSANGIFCGILLMPVLPFINDTPENILGIVNKAHKAGAKFVYPLFGLTLRENQRAYFYEQTQKHFPGIKEKYMRFFGNSYSCESPFKQNLYNIFSRKCDDLGILYKMPDIIAAYKQPKQQERDLFSL